MICGERNGVKSDIVYKLRRVLSEDHGGTVLLTTRFDSVAVSCSESVHVKPREVLSDTAKAILLNYSRFSEVEIEKEGLWEIVEQLLRLGGGVPVCLAILGRGVKKVGLKLRNRRALAWKIYFEKIRSGEGALLGECIDEYVSLKTTLSVALAVLEENNETPIVERWKFSWEEMYRSLCVMKKQMTIPLHVAGKMWSLRSVSQVKEVLEEFVSVGLGEIAYEEGEVRGFRVHDLLHSFAELLAKDKRELGLWHKRLLESYIGRGEDGKVRRWWSLEKDEYIHENLCRHLRDSGAGGELVELLLNAEWTAFRFECGGLATWKSDFSTCLEGLTDYDGRERKAEEFNKGLRLVRDAIAESWFYIRNNRNELRFQVYERLRGAKEEAVRKYLESIARYHAGPWLRCITRFLPRPGTARKGEVLVTKWVYHVVLHEDPFFAVAGVGEDVVVIDLEEMRVLKRLTGHMDLVKRVWVSENGERAMSLSEAWDIRVWNVRTGAAMGVVTLRPRRAESDYADWFRCGTFSSDGKVLVTGSENGNVEIWEVESGDRTEHVLTGLEVHVSCVAISTDRSRVVAGGVDGKLLVWNASTEEREGDFMDGHEGTVSSVAFSGDGRLIVSGSYDGTVRFWDAETKAQIGDALRGHEGYVTSVAFSADSSFVVSSSFDQSVRVWERPGGAALRPPMHHSEWVNCATVSASGRFIVSGGCDAVLRIWDLTAAPDDREKPIRHESDVCCVAGSADGQFFVSGSSDRKVRIWDACSGAPCGEALSGHTGIVSCLAVSPDCRRIVSGSWDNTLIEWDVAIQSQIGGAIHGHTSSITCVTYSADGRFIISGSSDGTVRMWRADDHAQVVSAMSGGVWTNMKEAFLLPQRLRELIKVLLSAVNVDFNAGEGNGSADVGGGTSESSEGERAGCRTLENDTSIGEPFCKHDSAVWGLARIADGQRIMCSVADGKLHVWDINSRRRLVVTEEVHRYGAAMLEITDENNVISMDYDRGVRWTFIEGGVLVKQSAYDYRKASSHARGSRSDLRELSGNIVICRDRAVQFACSDVVLGTLPFSVRFGAWHYNARRCVLCVGTMGGEVLIFEIDTET